MILALIFVAGLAMVIYRGIYLGPWSEVINTMGSALLAAMVVYIFLHIIFSVGSFFLRLLLVIIFAAVILIGGRKFWNMFNPDNPIHMPAAVSKSINSFSSDGK